jgi:hypothetical protein
MPDMLASGSAWLDTVCKEQISQTIVIEHGAATSGNVSATVGATLVGFDLGNGIVQSWQTTDFLIKADDFVVGSVETLPCLGMRINRTISGNDVQFEVLNADDGRCYRYSDDATRTMLRVHTREISRRPE